MIPSGHNCIVQTKKVKVILCVINYNTMMLSGSKRKLKLRAFLTLSVDKCMW